MESALRKHCDSNLDTKRIVILALNPDELNYGTPRPHQ